MHYSLSINKWQNRKKEPVIGLKVQLEFWNVNFVEKGPKSWMKNISEAVVFRSRKRNCEGCREFFKLNVPNL